MIRTIEDVLADQRAIVTGAEGRALTDDEVTRYEALEGEHRGVVRDAQIRARQAAYEAPATTPVSSAQVAADSGDEQLNRAFAHYLRTGRENQDVVALRAQSEGSGAAGGFLVPSTFRARLIERMKAFGGLGNVVDEFSTGDGRPVDWPTLDDTANSGAIAAEGAATPSGGADLVFGTKTLGAHKYTSTGASNLPLKVSVELLQDSQFDVESLVARKLGERIARAQAPHLITGTGVAQPLGITTGVTGTQTAANNALTYSDFVTYLHALDPAYLESDGVAWGMNFAALGVARKIVDLNGRPILEEANKGGATGLTRTILGYPVVIDQAFPTFTNNSPTVNWGVFGDLREAYVVRRVRDVQVVADPYTSASTGQVQYSAWARMDATVQNANAYIALTGKS